MIFALYFLMLQPQDIPLIVGPLIPAPAVVGAYDIDPEEIEAESTGGTY